jgi:hypothetical protein
MLPSLWGPPTWRVLHGLAHAVDGAGPGRGAAATHLWAAIDLLHKVMPCSLCRESLQGLCTGSQLVRLRAAGGPVGPWLHALHTCVNTKLAKARLAAVGVPMPQDPRLVSAVAPSLSWEALQARLVVTTPYFSARDVWVMVTLFAAAGDALPPGSPAAAARAADVCAFASALGRAMGAVGVYAGVASGLQAAFCGGGGGALLARVHAAWGVPMDTLAFMARAARVPDTNQ